MLVATLGCFAGCRDRADRYTEAEHLERVAALAEKRYMGEGSEYTSYEVHPVYNEYDELGYFVIDFLPQGYVYVKLNEQATPWLSMYTRDDFENTVWYPYTVEEGTNSVVYDENGTQLVYVNRKFKEDVEGNYISYRVSHFKAANIGEERRYFLPVESTIDLCLADRKAYVPAVKRGDSFLNLISMQTLQYSVGMKSSEQALMDMSYMPKSFSDL